MTSGRAGVRIAVVMASLAMLQVVGGCAGKRVTSTSGDQSMASKEKGAPGAVVESVRQDQVASVETPSPAAGSQSQDLRGSQFTPSAPGSASVPSGSLTPAAPGSTSVPSGSLTPPMPAGKAPAAADLRGLGDIYFDFDKYSIRKDAQPVLEGNARWLRLQAGKSFLIEGHCDERGTLAYNLVLGEKRAKSSKHYLEELGIPGSRIQTTSYGEVRPFCKEHNEGCWQKNRRAHFVVQ